MFRATLCTQLSSEFLQLSSQLCVYYKYYVIFYVYYNYVIIMAQAHHPPGLWSVWKCEQGCVEAWQQTGRRGCEDSDRLCQHCQVSPGGCHHGSVQTPQYTHSAWSRQCWRPGEYSHVYMIVYRQVLPTLAQSLYRK